MLLLVALLLALAVPLRAQTPPSHAAHISGVVIDSLVTGRPLAGAVVWIDALRLETTTDARGHFELDGVPPGVYVVGFQHDTLQASGFPASSTPVTVPDSVGTLYVTMATPSERTVYRMLCGAEPVDGTGVLLGAVTDAGKDQPLAGADVVSRWIEWTVVKGGIRNVVRERRASTDESGRFVICAIPSGVGVETRATARGHTAGAIDVDLGGHLLGVRRLAVSLQDSTTTLAAAADAERAPAEGSATIAGTVGRPDGKPLVGARVRVAGSGRGAFTDSSGAFVLARVPAGSQTVEARAIGYAPARVAVTLRDGASSRVAVTLVEAKQALPSVSVIGKRAVRRDISGFEDRRQHGFGHYITQADIERRRAFDATDLLRAVPGVHVVREGIGSGIITMKRGPSNCLPEVYVDGMPLADGAAGFDSYVNPSEIAGIEVYVGGATAPVQYSKSYNNCGVVLVWTRDR